MSTNYYFEDIDKDRQWNAFEKEVEELSKKYPDVHVEKVDKWVDDMRFSVCLTVNERIVWYMSPEEIKERLGDARLRLVDEYGRVYTWAEFKEKMRGFRNYEDSRRV